MEALRQGKVVELPRSETHLARVLRILRSDPGQAWRATEIAQELDADPHTIGAALRRLLARGLVDKKGRTGSPRASGRPRSSPARWPRRES